MSKEEILDFINWQELCVISTTHQNNTPEAAVVGFSSNEKLEILVGTSVKSRKYANIQRKPQVALVIGYAEKISVQLEGTAKEVTGEDLTPYLEDHFRKLPRTRKYLDSPDQRWILIIPKWLRYTDANQKPYFVQEIIL
jgi:general stress protein 26